MSLDSQRKRRSQFSPPKLMLTSMMDMFTIILIFLLCSFSDQPQTLDGLKDVELPHSSAEINYSDSVQIVLSQNTLKLNDDVIASVENEKIEGLDPENLKESALYEKLREIYDESKAEEADAEAVTEAETETETETPKHVLFLCDKSHNFKTINTVIKTAGLAGFPNFQFAVLEGVEE